MRAGLLGAVLVLGCGSAPVPRGGATLESALPRAAPEPGPALAVEAQQKERGLQEQLRGLLETVEAEAHRGLAERALANAAILAEHLGRLRQAARLHETLVTRYPKSQMVPESLRSLVQMHHAMMSLRAAELWTQRFLSKAFDHRGAQDVLWISCATRLEMEQVESAKRWCDTLVRTYPKAWDTPGADLALAELLEQKGHRAEACARYEKHARRFRTTVDTWMRATVRLATCKEEPQRSRLLRRMVEGAPGRDRASERDAVAEALYLLAEPERGAYEALRLDPPPRPLKLLRKRLMQKTRALQRAEVAYRRVLRAHSNRWTGAALVRMGGLYEHLARALLDFPSPTDASDEYGPLIEDTTAPLFERALETYRMAIKQTPLTEWSVRAAEAAQKLAPEEYPVLGAAGLVEAVRPVVDLPVAEPTGAEPTALLRMWRRALALERAGKIPDAKVEHYRILESWPSGAHATAVRESIARLELGDSQPGPALTMLRELPTDAPGLKTHRAAALAALGRWQEAENAARDALWDDRRDVTAYALLADLLDRKGELLHARLAVHQAIRIATERSDRHGPAAQATVLAMSGYLGLKRGRANRRAEHGVRLHKAAALGPSPAAHVSLGVMELHGGRYAESRKHFTEALKHAPGRCDALLGEATALFAARRDPEAIQAYRTLLGRCSGQAAETHERLLDGLIRTQRLREAEAHCATLPPPSQRAQTADRCETVRLLLSK